MSEPRKKYDSTVARIAGNLLSGVLTTDHYRQFGYGYDSPDVVVTGAVKVARAIVAETQRQAEESEPA